MTATPPQSSLGRRDQLQQWGVLALMALLLIGIALFIFLALLPDVRRRAEYGTLLASAEAELSVAQLARAQAPVQVQARLQEAEQRLVQTAQGFLNEAESALVVNRLYTYAEAAAVEITNLQAAPPVVTPTHSQRDYRFQVAGTVPTLLDFLGRIEEVNLPGFVVGSVSLAPDPADEEQHILAMNVSVLASSYSTFTVMGGTQEPAVASSQRSRVIDLPVAEVQRQLELAWEGREWNDAVDLLVEVTAAMPENEVARTALYRAYLNSGYTHLSERDYAAAEAAFENALALYPEGREATNELAQLSRDNTLSHRVEDELRQGVEVAKASNNWQEVIRLLRLIAAVDPGYGPVGEELTQAYISYGNQLAGSGDDIGAQEQYQLADYTPPDQVTATSGDGILVESQPVTQTATP